MKLAGAMVLVMMAAAAAEEPGAFSDLGFDAACAKAKEGNRIVLVDFFTTWCGPCKKLDKTTWQDAKVKAWLFEKAVALKIDAEKEEKLADRYHVNAYPTVILLKPDGTEIDRLVGYRSADEFLRDAADALAGRDAVTRAKAKLEGHEKDPALREGYAEALAERGRNEEALAEFLWCWDHGLESEPGYAAVRTTFLLSKIGELGAGYAPALEALRKRRDACSETLLAGKGTRDDAGDLAALDRELDEEAKTLEVYDALAKKEGAAEVREALFDRVFPALVDARRYAELIGRAPDAVERLFKDWKEAADALAKEKTEDTVDEERAARESLVDGAAAYFEVYLGSGKKDEASALADRLVAASPRGSTWAALIGHATHAGDNELARSLVERGLKAVKGKGAKAIKEAAKAIPEK